MRAAPHRHAQWAERWRGSGRARVHGAVHPGTKRVSGVTRVCRAWPCFLWDPVWEVREWWCPRRAHIHLLQSPDGEVDHGSRASKYKSKCSTTDYFTRGTVENTRSVDGAGHAARGHVRRTAPQHILHVHRERETIAVIPQRPNNVRHSIPAASGSATRLLKAAHILLFQKCAKDAQTISCGHTFRASCIVRHPGDLSLMPERTTTRCRHVPGGCMHLDLPCDSACTMQQESLLQCRRHRQLQRAVQPQEVCEIVQAGPGLAQDVPERETH